MAVTVVCIAVAVVALIATAASSSESYRNRFQKRFPFYRRYPLCRSLRSVVVDDGDKARCPDRPILVSPDEGIFSRRIFDYMMLISVDSKLLPHGQRPYLLNSTRYRLLDTFTSVALPVLEDIPKTCPSHSYITAVGNTIVYNESTVAYCKTQKACFEAFNTDKYIVISPFLQFLELIANNIGNIRTALKFRQLLVDLSQRTIRRYGEYFIKTNNMNISAADLNYVGVHVRRKDVERSLTITHEMQALRAEYYLKAMNFFRYECYSVGNTVFLIVTDDLLWAAEHLLVNNDTFIATQGSKYHPEYDLTLLTLCNDTVLDYGGFAFIAYVLGRQGITVSTDVDKQLFRVFSKSPNWRFFNVTNNGTLVS